MGILGSGLAVFLSCSLLAPFQEVRVMRAPAPPIMHLFVMKGRRFRILLLLDVSARLLTCGCGDRIVGRSFATSCLLALLCSPRDDPRTAASALKDMVSRASSSRIFTVLGTIRPSGRLVLRKHLLLARLHDLIGSLV